MSGIGLEFGGVSGLWLRLEPGCSRQGRGLGLRVTVSVLGSGFRVRGWGSGFAFKVSNYCLV